MRMGESMDRIQGNLLCDLLCICLGSLNKRKGGMVVASLLVISGISAGCAGYQEEGFYMRPHLSAAACRMSREGYPVKMGMAAFEVREVIRGAFATNVVTVMFDSESIPTGGLPREAILILQNEDWLNNPPADGWYRALGGDAYRGILPDTAENRRWVEGATLSQLVENRKSAQLSRREAIRVAKKKAKERYGKEAEEADYSAIRCEFGYGWTVFMDMQTRWIREAISVGDDGRVKGDGLGMK